MDYETDYQLARVRHQLLVHEYEVVRRNLNVLESEYELLRERLAITENALKVHQFELERMSARIARIRELHQPDVVNDGPHMLVLCRECMHPMDCPTIQALDGDPE